ncbi:MAG: hypothetical protein HY248_01460, partial [Fimbriimonas ginsengisoli]|nr:hypothetical protein [Fimbriimonas ginsengisoli]
RGPFTIGVAAIMWTAAVLHQALSFRLVIFGARPDLLLVVGLALCLLMERRQAAWVGFASGVLMGAMAMANLASYVVSRTLTSYGVSYSEELELRSSPWGAGAVCAAGTILANLILMFLAPPPLIGPFLGATIRTAVYNGVLAVPVFLLLRRALGPLHRS